MAYIDQVMQRNAQRDQQTAQMREQQANNFKTIASSLTKIGMDIADTATTNDANAMYSAEELWMQEHADDLSMKDGNYLTTKEQVASRYDELHTQFMAEYMKDHNVGSIAKSKYNTTFDKYKETNILKQTIANQQTHKKALQTQAQNHVTNELPALKVQNTEEYVEDIVRRNNNFNTLMSKDSTLQMWNEQLQLEIKYSKLTQEELKATGIDLASFNPNVTAKKIDAYLSLINSGTDVTTALVTVNNLAFNYASEELFSVTREQAEAFANMSEYSGHVWTEDELKNSFKQYISTISSNGLAGYGYLQQNQIDSISASLNNQLSVAKTQWNNVNADNYTEMQIEMSKYEKSENSDGVMNRFYDIDSFYDYLTQHKVDINWMKQNRADDLKLYYSRILDNSALKTFYDASQILYGQSSDITEEENNKLAVEAEQLIASNPSCREFIKRVYGDTFDIHDNIDVGISLSDIMQSMTTLSAGTRNNVVDTKISQQEEINYNKATTELKSMKANPTGELNADSIYSDLLARYNIREGSEYATKLRELVDTDASEINTALLIDEQNRYFKRYQEDNFVANNKTMKPSDLKEMLAQYNEEHPETPIDENSTMYKGWEDALNTNYAKELGSTQKAIDLNEFDKAYWKYVSDNGGSSVGFDVESVLAQEEFGGRLSMDDVLKYSEYVNEAEVDSELATKRFDFLEAINESDSRESIIAKAQEIGLSQDDSTVANAITKSISYSKLQQKETNINSLKKYVEDLKARSEQVKYSDIVSKGEELGLSENDIWDAISGMDSYYTDSIYDGLSEGILSNIDAINAMDNETFKSYYDGLSVAEKSAMNMLMMSSKDGTRIDLTAYIGEDGNTDYVKEIIKGLVSRDYAKATSSTSDIINGIGDIKSSNTPAARFIGDMVSKYSDQIVLSMFFIDPKLSIDYGDVGVSYLSTVSGRITRLLPEFSNVSWNDLSQEQKDHAVEVAKEYGVNLDGRDFITFSKGNGITLADFSSYVAGRHRDEQIMPMYDMYKQYESLPFGAGTQTIKEYVNDLVTLEKNSSNNQIAIQYIGLNNGHVGDTIPIIDGYQWPRTMMMEAKMNYIDAFNSLMNIPIGEQRTNFLYTTVDRSMITAEDWENLKLIADGDINATLNELGFDAIDVNGMIISKMDANGHKDYNNDPIFTSTYSKYATEIINDIASGNIKKDSISEYINSKASDIASEYAWNSANGGAAKVYLNSSESFPVYDRFTDDSIDSPEAWFGVFDSFAMAASSSTKDLLYAFQGGVAPQCQGVITAIAEGKGSYETVDGIQGGDIEAMTTMLFGTSENKIGFFGVRCTDSEAIANSMCTSLALAMQASGISCVVTGDDFNKSTRNLTYERVGTLLNSLGEDVRAGVLYSAMQIYTLSHNQSQIIESDLPRDFAKSFSMTKDGTFKNANGDVISFDKNGNMNVTYRLSSGESQTFPASVFESGTSASDILSGIDKSLSGMKLEKSSGYNPEWIHHLEDVVTAINKANEIRNSLNAKGYSLPYISFGTTNTSSRIGSVGTGFYITTSDTLPSREDPVLQMFNTQYSPYNGNATIKTSEAFANSRPAGGFRVRVVR